MPCSVYPRGGEVVTSPNSGIERGMWSLFDVLLTYILIADRIEQTRTIDADGRLKRDDRLVYWIGLAIHL